MATTNGIHSIDGVGAPLTQLGKRKRSSSSQPKTGTQTLTNNASAHDLIDKALTIIQEDELGQALLNHPLPSSRVKDTPATKRRRTQSANHAAETISDRFHNKTYQSLNQLLNDIDEVKQSVEPQTNGHDGSEPLTAQQVDRIRDLIVESQQVPQELDVTSDEKTSNPELKPEHNRLALQLLSLRGQTDGGVRQLFTGLPKNKSDGSTDADTKRLPNGFEMIDSALMNITNKNVKDGRVFGDVFTSYRSQKHLEPPRQFRSQDKQLEFVPTLSKLGASNKQDYRNAILGTGTWLSYATNDLHRTKGEVSKPSSAASNADSLFKAAFSSFAPIVDHSNSVVTEPDRARQWFRSRAMIVPFEETSGGTISSKDPEEESDVASIKLADNLEDIVENFISEADVEGRDESEVLLDEISELVKTLSSYQAVRDLDKARGPGSESKPTQPEVDTYELLRTQLQLVIDALPPHAVAKLNGDQMEALNIRTNLLLTQVEIVGTAQADDYTLRKQRGLQFANNSVGRGPAGVSSRQSYTTPNPAYGQQGSSYVQGSATATGYGVRPAGSMYTPRPSVSAQTPQYSSQPYRGTSTPYTNAAIHPNQQPSGSQYNQSFVPKPSQPGYQQRAQDRTTNWQRADSPQKALPNGQTPHQYQPRQYAGPNQGAPNASALSSTAMQQRLLEQMKQQQSTSSQSGPTS